MFRRLLLVIQLLLLCFYVRGETEKSSVLFEEGFHTTGYIYDKTVEIVSSGGPTTHFWLPENLSKISPIIQLGPKQNISGLGTALLRAINKGHMESTYQTLDKNIVAKPDETFKFYAMFPLLMNKPGLVYKILGFGTGERYPVNTVFGLACSGNGWTNFTLTWVDATGSPIPSEKRTSEYKDRYFITRLLNVSADGHDAAFGCQMMGPHFKAPFTRWFNFTRIDNTQGKAEVDTSICGQVTFSCVDSDSEPEKVEWIVNEDTYMERSHDLTLKLDEIDLKNVTCIIKHSPYVKTTAFFEFTNSEIPTCVVEPGASTVDGLEMNIPVPESSYKKHWTLWLIIAGEIVAALIMTIIVSIRICDSMNRKRPYTCISAKPKKTEADVPKILLPEIYQPFV